MGSRADQTKDALIQAVLEMLTEEGPSTLSAREVAARAGVNHGLVHRYFGSRQGLIDAAVERLAVDIHAGDPGSPGMSAPAFRYLRRHPHLARLVARACLDDHGALMARAAPTPERLADIVAPIQALLDRMGLGATLDAHVVNGLASAAFLGWFAFRPLLESGFGLPEDADDQLETALARIDALVGSLTPSNES